MEDYNEYLLSVVEAAKERTAVNTIAKHLSGESVNQDDLHKAISFLSEYGNSVVYRLWYAEVIKSISDETSRNMIGSLHPAIRLSSALMILDAQKQGRQLRITSGYRSIDEQNKLYAQGRTTPGQIVTNAKGGQSYHNFGVAFDVVEIKGGAALWDNDWDEIGKIGKMYGLEWGGDWVRFLDRPHFQMTFGLSESDMYKRFSQGDLTNGFIAVY